MVDDDLWVTGGSHAGMVYNMQRNVDSDSNRKSNTNRSCNSSAERHSSSKSDCDRHSNGNSHSNNNSEGIGVLVQQLIQQLICSC